MTLHLMHSGGDSFNMAVFGTPALVRSASTLCLLLLCAPSVAALTCDQVGNVALATEQYRNQGEPLQVLLAEVDKLAGDGKMSKDDLALMKRTVQESYDRTRTPLEIRKECKDVPGK
jgi:hypothetical protein